MRRHLGDLGVPAPVRRSRDPFSVLVSTIVSLRTRDPVTERVSSRVLERFPDPAAMSRATPEELGGLLREAGFHRQKARQLLAISSILLERRGGEVPSSREELLSLPGVGRKTANYVLGMVFGVPAVCVDTHVHRISRRLGLAPPDGGPADTEEALMERLPEEEWTGLNHVMVRFGQRVCRPVRPLCAGCPLGGWCPSARHSEE